MRLKVLLPSRVEVDTEVDKISADGAEGSFTVLPHHVDYVSPLTAGLLAYETGGQEHFLAVDGGMLVKVGDEVLVSSPRAVSGSLGELQQAVAEQFEKLSEQEAQAQTVVEKIQADFVRRFVELEHRG